MGADIPDARPEVIPVEPPPTPPRADDGIAARLEVADQDLARASRAADQDLAQVQEAADQDLAGSLEAAGQQSATPPMSDGELYKLERALDPPPSPAGRPPDGSSASGAMPTQVSEQTPLLQGAVPDGNQPLAKEESVQDSVKTTRDAAIAKTPEVMQKVADNAPAIATAVAAAAAGVNLDGMDADQVRSAIEGAAVKLEEQAHEAVREQARRADNPIRP
jgi:hypothetical protein